jgi:hypothetical protein
MTAIQRVITAAFAVFTLAVTANAAKAGEFTVGYSLTANQISDPIAPPPNIPVQLTGVNLTTAGLPQDVGQVALLRAVGGTVNFIAWVGMNSAGAGMTSGRSAFPTTKIVSIDSNQQVLVEVAAPGDLIRVHCLAACAGTQTGSVTLTW